MEQSYNLKKKFERINFTDEAFPIGEYEACEFLNCDLSNSDLSNCVFFESIFIGCNLSLAKIKRTSFREMNFKDCKMLGLHFEHCNEFGLTIKLENCNLNHSSFYRTKLKKTEFIRTQLQEVDFTDCDLTLSIFEKCDLLNAHFENTVLEKADLRTSFNFNIDPTQNKIKGAMFGLSNIEGLLYNYDIEIDRSF